MYQIDQGIRNGLSDKQISMYAKAGFSSYQMEEIRLGLENGLSDLQVGVYAKANISWDKMAKKRKELEKECFNQIKQRNKMKL